MIFEILYMLFVIAVDSQVRNLFTSAISVNFIIIYFT